MDGPVTEPGAPTIDSEPLFAGPDEIEPATSTRSLSGPVAAVVTLLAVGLSLYALYWVIGIIQPQIYRNTFLLIVLILTFFIYPARAAARDRTTATDWLLVATAVVALAWPILDFDQFVYRAATPTLVDLVLGAATIVIVLEATRRTIGLTLPVTAILFLAYAMYGPWLDYLGLSLVAHRGYDAARIIGTLYMTLEGIFGVPLDVATTYIILFTVFGAMLQYSGAGRFFLTWATAALGQSGAAGPGRAVTLSGLLLGAVSGSGVATTVTIGSVAWPLLRRAGYRAEEGGAILSAAGIGAILSPPTMGAAAFLIAEFLKISYLQVLSMAVIPTALYYLGIYLMMEADTHRMHAHAIQIEVPPLGVLTRRYWYHFSSLFVIVALMVWGMTPFRAVFWATMLVIALSFLHAETALWPRRLLRALEAGGRSILPVAATTATAGIIVGVVTLTGLGLKMAGIIVALAAGNVFLTVLYAAVAVWILGLAVPVTASYIIAAVIIAPALTIVGVPDVAAHMFIFYYAVLSEVSPPTALSPFAAAAITGGNPFRTMMLTWRYTLPAFLVPIIFTLDRSGMGLLLRAPLPEILRTSLTAAVGVSALALGLGGWLRGPLRMPERIIGCAGGLLLFSATLTTDVAGSALLAIALGLHFVRRKRRG